MRGVNLASKARGALPPWTPHQGLSPWNLVPVSEERGIATTGVSEAGGAPLLTDRNRVLRAVPLVGVQGAKPPGLTCLKLTPRIASPTP